MEIQFLPLEPEAAHDVREGLLAVYGAAFSQPPYLEKDYQIRDFETTLERHRKRPGFTGWMARAGLAGSLVGFAYGYASRPGSWWYEHVTRGLNREHLNGWMDDAFEFVELAVTPEWQGQGIGGRLHDLILTGLPYHSAVLSAWPGTNAEQMYHKRGWVTLLENYAFLIGGPRYDILGIKLPFEGEGTRETSRQGNGK